MQQKQFKPKNEVADILYVLVHMITQAMLWRSYPQNWKTNLNK